MHDMVERKITNNPSICISFVPPFSQTRPKMNFSGCPDRAFHFAPGIKFVAGPSESISSSKWIHLPQKQNPIWTFYKTLHPRNWTYPKWLAKCWPFQLMLSFWKFYLTFPGVPVIPEPWKNSYHRWTVVPGAPITHSVKVASAVVHQLLTAGSWFFEPRKKKKNINMKYRWVYIGILVILHYCNIPT